MASLSCSRLPYSQNSMAWKGTVLHWILSQHPEGLFTGHIFSSVLQHNERTCLLKDAWRQWGGMFGKQQQGTVTAASDWLLLCHLEALFLFIKTDVKHSAPNPYAVWLWEHHWILVKCDLLCHFPLQLIPKTWMWQTEMHVSFIELSLIALWILINCFSLTEKARSAGIISLNLKSHGVNTCLDFITICILIFLSFQVSSLLKDCWEAER